MKDLTNQLDPLTAKLMLKMMYVKLLQSCATHPDPGMAQVANDELSEFMVEVEKLTNQIQAPNNN